MTNLDSILKSRHIILPTKVHLVKVMVFPVVTYGCESWTVKKAEHRKIDAFELWCWRRLLRVPWTARRSNQSILRGISPGCSLEGLMLKLKLQYFGHLMWRVDSLEKKLMLQEEKGTTEDEMAGWHHWLDGHEFGWTLGVGDGQGGLACCDSWSCKESDTIEWLNWTDTLNYLEPPEVFNIYSKQHANSSRKIGISLTQRNLQGDCSKSTQSPIHSWSCHKQTSSNKNDRQQRLLSLKKWKDRTCLNLKYIQVTMQVYQVL